MQDDMTINFSLLDIAQLREWAETKAKQSRGDKKAVAKEIVISCNQLQGFLTKMEELLDDSRNNK
jgi:hypothetical protein